MSMLGLFRLANSRRRHPKPATRRRVSPWRPSPEGLEDRVVLSHATAAALLAPAQVHALATTGSQSVSVPMNVAGIVVTGVTRNATTSVVSFSANLTGTVLGQIYTTPVSGTVTPGRNARVSPVLNLSLQPVNLSIVGLNVKTSAINLNLTATRGALGNVLSSGLNGVVTSASNGSTATATTQLDTLLNNSQLISALDRSLGQARPRLTSFTPAQGTNSPVLNFALSPDRVSVSGLNARLDNGGHGPITVNVSATRGQGLLGNLLFGLTGNPTGRNLTREVNAVLNQITSTPVPSASVLIASATPSTPATSSTALADPTLVTLDLKPLDINLLGLEVKTSEIIVTVSALPGSGELLGNLLTTVANLVNLQGVSNALNNVLSNVVTLANSAGLSVSGVLPGGPLGLTTSTAAVPVLTAHVAPVHLNLLGAVVDTSPIDLSITAHPGPGNVLGNVVADLAALLNTPPKNGKLDIPFLTSQIQTLNNQLAAITPSIPAAPSPPHTVPSGTTNVLSLNVAPINLNLLGLVLHTDQIQVNADAQSGSNELLGNLLTDLLNTLNGTPANLSALNTQVNNLLAKVVGILNNTSLTLPSNVLSTLSQTLQTLALPNLVNTTGTPATAPVLDLNIATTTGTAPPVDVNLLGLVITTSDIHATLVAQTGDGQILGNLVYNVAHLLDPGGSLSLLTILNDLGL